jgi:toxin ParE1/3/4
MRLVYSRKALADLDAMYSYIARDKPRAAVEFTEDIRKRLDSLAAHPELGHVRQGFPKHYRLFPLDRKVTAVYALYSDHAKILRIFYGGRDYDAIMLRSSRTKNRKASE